jgi:hypothetical protein
MRRHDSTDLKGSGRWKYRIALPYSGLAPVEASSDYGNEPGVR